MPLVIIFLPVYNSEKTIESTLNSLLNQTYENYLIYISYDKSEDKTLSIINSIDSKKIILDIREDEPGLFQNMNYCIDIARKFVNADYVTIYNSDDIYSNEILAQQVRFLEINISCSSVFAEGFFIDEKDNFIGVSKNKIYNKENPDIYTYENLFIGCIRSNATCLSPTFMVRQSILANDVNLKQKPEIYAQAADFGFFMEIAKKYGPVGVIKKPLISYRVWKGNSTSKLFKSLPSLVCINELSKDPDIIKILTWVDYAYIQKQEIWRNNEIIKHLVLNNKNDEIKDIHYKYDIRTYLISLFSYSGIYNMYFRFCFGIFCIFKLENKINNLIIEILSLNQFILIMRKIRNLNYYFKYFIKH